MKHKGEKCTTGWISQYGCTDAKVSRNTSGVIDIASAMGDCASQPSVVRKTLWPVLAKEMCTEVMCVTSRWSQWKAPAECYGKCVEILLNHKIKLPRLLNYHVGKQLSELLIHCLENNGGEINFCHIKPEVWAWCVTVTAWPNLTDTA